MNIINKFYFKYIVKELMRYKLHKLFCLLKINGYIRSYSDPKRNKYLFVRHYYYDL